LPGRSSRCELGDGTPSFSRKVTDGELFGGTLDRPEPGAKQLEKTPGDCPNHLSCTRPTSDPVKVATSPFEQHGGGAQSERVSRPQEREYGSDKSALALVLPVELIVDIANRAPPVPEVGIWSQCGSQPRRGLLHPAAVEMTQLAVKWRCYAARKRTKNAFGRNHGGHYE
jgi:hypothetical protein